MRGKAANLRQSDPSAGHHAPVGYHDQSVRRPASRLFSPGGGRAQAPVESHEPLIRTEPARVDSVARAKPSEGNRSPRTANVEVSTRRMQTPPVGPTNWSRGRVEARRSWPWFGQSRARPGFEVPRISVLVHGIREKLGFSLTR